jgi:hypothetical protein
MSIPGRKTDEQAALPAPSSVTGGSNDWPWAETVAAIVPFVAFLSAVLVWCLGQGAARRDRRASAFAAALAAVEKYAEFPYRIRRRAGTDDARYLLSDAISETQAEIAFHQLWLDLEAPTAGASYRDLGRPARRQAGQQMNSAWLEPVIANDANMNRGGRRPARSGR